MPWKTVPSGDRGHAHFGPVRGELEPLPTLVEEPPPPERLSGVSSFDLELEKKLYRPRACWRVISSEVWRPRSVEELRLSPT